MIILDPVAWAAAVQHGFSPGKHQANSPDRCVMEALAAATGAKHTDFPPCVARPLARLLQSANDGKLVTTQDLAAMAETVVGTNDLITRRIAFVWTDYAARVLAPAYLDGLGKPAQAAALRALSPVADAATAGLAEAAVSGRSSYLHFVTVACDAVAKRGFWSACDQTVRAVLPVVSNSAHLGGFRHSEVAPMYTAHVWGLIRAALATRTPTTPEAP